MMDPLSFKKVNESLLFFANFMKSVSEMKSNLLYEAADAVLEREARTGDNDRHHFLSCWLIGEYMFLKEIQELESYTNYLEQLNQLSTTYLVGAGVLHVLWIPFVCKELHMPFSSIEE